MQKCPARPTSTPFYGPGHGRSQKNEFVSRFLFNSCGSRILSQRESLVPQINVDHCALLLLASPLDSEEKLLTVQSNCHVFGFDARQLASLSFIPVPEEEFYYILRTQHLVGREFSFAKWTFEASICHSAMSSLRATWPVIVDLLVSLWRCKCLIYPGFTTCSYGTPHTKCNLSSHGLSIDFTDVTQMSKLALEWSFVSCLYAAPLIKMTIQRVTRFLAAYVDQSKAALIRMTLSTFIIPSASCVILALACPSHIVRTVLQCAISASTDYLCCVFRFLGPFVAWPVAVRKVK